MVQEFINPEAKIFMLVSKWKTEQSFLLFLKCMHFGFARVYCNPPFVTPIWENVNVYLEDSSHFQPR